MAGAEPERTLAGQRLKAQNSCVGRRVPQARKSEGARGVTGKGAGGIPYTAAFQPYLQLRSPPPSPTPLGALFPDRGGDASWNPPWAASRDTPRMLRAAEPLTWGRGAGI